MVGWSPMSTIECILHFDSKQFCEMIKMIHALKREFSCLPARTFGTFGNCCVSGEHYKIIWFYHELMIM